MNVNLLTEPHLVFLSLKGGCTGESESTHVKMPHCWKSHVTAHTKLIYNYVIVKLFVILGHTMVNTSLFASTFTFL